ncbi:hypothetical protein P3X46_028276 [Hevea brasiliensis]|uniref:MTTase N-terminal domain-containing protein n=1 Tax=Hevea brasiliensis TaxID=3981 RepID=A0ABQ9KRH4_HEVBR|nr:hypothetical protein P3X46_028276 [Hevea brasiliensis]
MEHIDDLLIASGGGVAPGFRLPLNAPNLNASKLSQIPFSSKIPGTWTIYINTFGYSHNQLSSLGYALTDIPEDADLWLVNTVKVPKKPLVVAGCVPQVSKNLKELEGVSIVGVQQMDRVVEVVEETLEGHKVRLLNCRTLPALDLPKVRNKKFVEILPINVGCLGACTYCKTKHARGHLVSYTVHSLVGRVRTVIADGIVKILEHMYNVSVFRTVVDTLTELVPGMQIATDITCGFPGTPAARMKKVSSNIAKRRSHELTSVFEAFTPYSGMEGRVERIWITEIATDGIHLVDHTKAYVQALVVAPKGMLGTSAIVKITSVGRWSVFGEVIQTLNPMDGKAVSSEHLPGDYRYPPSSDPCETCACSKEPVLCDCGPESSGGQNALEESAIPQNNMLLDGRNRRNLIGWLLRKQKNQMHKRVDNGLALGSMKKQEWTRGNSSMSSIVDRALVGGMLVSLLTIAALLIHICFWTI